MTSKSDNKLSLPEEKENFILTLEETEHQSLPDLTPITETSEEDSDDDSMPELIYCTGCSDCCCNFGIENKNIQPEQPIDYNDEEIEKREERYEKWKKNNQIRFLTLDSPLLKEIEEEEN
jgi:hypothetical protein